MIVAPLEQRTITMNALGRRLQDSIMQWSRQRKLRHFYSLCPPGSKVLDVGVSGMDDGYRSLNFFLSHYRYDPSTYTGLGIEEMTHVQARFPHFRFVKYDGRIFPFGDREFDWVHSNAVIEHVGNEEAQLLFLSEMLRVARNVYFTTPNRYFPIEIHSSQVLRHWNREAFHEWAERTEQPWLTAEQLRLLSYADLVGLLKRSGATRYRIFRNRFLGWTMTMSVVAERH